jgi:hypothetical protein
VTNFDAIPEVPAISDDARVKRFLGAFTGGVLVLGAAMAVMPFVGGPCFGGTCFGAGQALLGGFAPLLAVGGAWLGFEVMGGDGGLLTPIISIAPAILVSLGLLAIARETNANSAVDLMPYLISAGVFLAGGAALALDARARQLDNLGSAASWGKATPGRVALTVLTSSLAGLSAVIVSALLFSLNQYSSAGVILMVSTAAVGALGAAAAAWGVHRGLQGRGSFLSAVAGMGLALTVSGAGLGLFALATGGFAGSPIRAPAALTLAVSLAAMSAMFFPMLALEWSHTNAIEASLPKLSFGVAPTPNGGMIAAGMRF